MAITWNTEQLKAIHLTNKNCIVSASAGAGKTTVLIARLMKRIVEDKVSIDKVIAMTFTEAAAAEMKKRLSIALSEAYSKEPSDYLKQQMALLPSASISTIHSFCLHILKNYYYIIQLDPSRVNTILDDATLSIIKKQALNKVLQTQYSKKDSVFLQLLETFSPSAIDTNDLTQAILDISKAALRQYDYASYLNQLSNAYQVYPTIQSIPEPLQTLFFDSLQMDISILIEMIEELYHHVTFQYPQEEERIQQLNLKKEKASYILSTIQERNYNRFIQATISCTEVPLKTAMKEDSYYKKLREDIQNYAKDYLTILHDESLYLKSIAYQKPLIELLVDMTKQFIDEYNQQKALLNGIDFDDMERYAYTILQANDNEIAKQYQLHYDEIMVDEFQDTNEIQNAMVELISRGNNIFRVGDIKQSIYRFRGAKPSIMQNLMQDASYSAEVIYLNNNYRSKQTIVDFNNYVFHQLMNVKGLNSRYQKEDYVVTGIPKQNENCNPVEFHLIDKKNMIDIEENSFDMESSVDNDIKAEYIAQQILHLKQTQNRNFKDFVVLVRNHNLKLNLKIAFDRTNIPCFVALASGFYQSNGVLSVISYLKSIVNPDDTISMLSILKNIYQFTNDELVQYRKGILPLDNSIYEDLHLLQNPSLSLTDVLTTIYQIHSFYDLHCTKQEKTNLDLLFEKAEQFQIKQNSILAFIEFIQQIEEEKTSEAISMNSEDDVVRVMTMHQSKGLQFPVVFFWSNFRQDNQEKKKKLVCDESLGIALHYIEMPQRYVYPSLYRKAIDYLNNKEDFEEQMRLLYVGLTRAQEHMIIVDAITKEVSNQPISLSSIFKRIGFSGWLKKCLSVKQDFCKIQIIDKSWSSQSHAFMHSTPVTLPIYTKPKKEYQTITPSSYKQKQEYLLNLNQNNFGSDFGTEIHSIIEKLPNTNWTKDIILDIAPSLSIHYIDKLMHFYESTYYQEWKQYTIEKELNFVVDDNDIIIHGSMDMVVLKDDSCIVIDFKTDAVIDRLELVDSYTKQIQTYKKALSILYPNTIIKAYIYSFSLEEFITL